MAEVVTEVVGRTLKLSNLDKVLYPNGFTKGEVIAYYHAIAPVLLPHLRGRPVTRIRYPHGTAQPGFFEKNAPAGAPGWLRIHTVDGSEGRVDYPIADSLPALLYLANLAALELHTHQWRVPDAADRTTVSPDLPVDRLVIDLDPGDGVGMPLIAAAALLVAGDLAQAGLPSAVKTSGSKGLQVYVPVEPTPASAVHSWAQGLGRRLVEQHPGLFVTEIARAARTGRILLDVNQNLPGRTTVSPYSLRARPEPMVSTPLTWTEVEAAVEGAGLAFSAAQVLARVERHGDLFGMLIHGRRGSLST